jgi:hypothetical protein
MVMGAVPVGGVPMFDGMGRYFCRSVAVACSQCADLSLLWAGGHSGLMGFVVGHQVLF